MADAQGTLFGGNCQPAWTLGSPVGSGPALLGYRLETQLNRDGEFSGFGDQACIARLCALHALWLWAKQRGRG